MILFFLFLSLFSPETVYATHEADHRYTVSGYVRDEAGKPIPNLSVALEHKGGEKKIAVTDRRGHYETLFHLHSDNAGDEMIVTAGSEIKKIKVAFDPEDRFTDRRGGVDFGAPGKPESDWIYWTGGAGLLVGVGVYFGFFRKKRKREKKKEPHRKKKK